MCGSRGQVQRLHHGIDHPFLLQGAEQPRLIPAAQQGVPALRDAAADLVLDAQLRHAAVDELSKLSQPFRIHGQEVTSFRAL